MAGVDKKFVQLQKAACEKEKKQDMKRKRQTSDFDNTVELTDADTGSSSTTSAENSTHEDECTIDPSKPSTSGLSSASKK